MLPLLVPLIVPLLTMIPITQDPNGTLARVMSYIPLFTPFVMMNRAAGSPPLWEYLATTVLLLLSIYFAVRPRMSTAPSLSMSPKAAPRLTSESCRAAPASAVVSR